MASPVQQVTKVSTGDRAPGRADLVGYLTTAVVVRTSDAGAAVGLLLLTGDRLPASGSLGGLLVSGYALPHLLGPLLARRLDRSTDPRRLLAGSFVLAALALGGVVLLLGRAPLPVTVGLVLLAGCCGPLLTSGMSSQLGTVVPDWERQGRRAQGLDAMTYGVAGTAGPAAVAATASGLSAAAALLLLAGLTLVGAAGCLRLRRPGGPATDPAQERSLVEVLALLVRDGRLRRVNACTMITNLAQGGMAVAAVALAVAAGESPTAGALLAASLGVGTLVGSVAVSVVPLRREPDPLVSGCTVVVGVALVGCGILPGLAGALVGFGLVGVGTALFVTATFAARTQYAPAAERAQVFAAMASVKIAAGSAGAALAALLVGTHPRLYLLAAAALVILAGLLTTVDQRRSTSRQGRSVAAEPLGRAPSTGSQHSAE